jgi:hypothetical protein
MATTPMILTLELEEPSQIIFDGLRQKYFPAHANFIAAHLTLFHTLPFGNTVIDEIVSKAARRPTFNMEVASVRNLGKAVVFEIVSDELQLLHQEMQLALDGWLTHKDRERIWPHITIQNKVSAFKAAAVYAELASSFEPYSIRAMGIKSWRYIKGPWEPIQYFPFI